MNQTNMELSSLLEQKKDLEGKITTLKREIKKQERELKNQDEVRFDVVRYPTGRIDWRVRVKVAPRYPNDTPRWVSIVALEEREDAIKEFDKVLRNLIDLRKRISSEEQEISPS